QRGDAADAGADERKRPAGCGDRARLIVTRDPDRQARQYRHRDGKLVEQPAPRIHAATIRKPSSRRKPGSVCQPFGRRRGGPRFRRHDEFGPARFSYWAWRIIPTGSPALNSWSDDMPEPAANLDEIRALMAHLPGPDLDAGTAAAAREAQ